MVTFYGVLLQNINVTILRTPFNILSNVKIYIYENKMSLTCLMYPLIFLIYVNWLSYKFTKSLKCYLKLVVVQFT